MFSFEVFNSQIQLFPMRSKLTLIYESFQSYLILLHNVLLFTGFKVGVEKHSTEVIVKKKSGSLLINSGIQGYSLLKTTQVFLQLASVILRPSVT